MQSLYSNGNVAISQVVLSYLLLCEPRNQSIFLNFAEINWFLYEDYTVDILNKFLQKSSK